MEQKKPQDICLIGFDLDGTVLQDFGGLSPAVRAAMQKAICEGVAVAPATGRQLASIPDEILNVPGIRYALTANGARIFDLTTKELIHEDCFTAEEARRMLSVLRQFNALIGVYVNEKSYNEHPPEAFRRHMPEKLIKYLQKTRSFVPDVAAVLQQTNQPVEKFTMVFNSMEEKQHALEILNARGDNFTSSSLHTNLEVNTKTANKGTGLLLLGEHMGLQPHQIMAIGDGSNDIGMLKAAGYGVAMGNAPPEVKKAADAVTLPCAEDGVAAAIEQILKWRR